MSQLNSPYFCIYFHKFKKKNCYFLLLTPFFLSFVFPNNSIQFIYFPKVELILKKRTKNKFISIKQKKKFKKKKDLKIKK